LTCLRRSFIDKCNKHGKFSMKKIALAVLAIYAVSGLVGCGGGGSGAGNGAPSTPAPLTPAQVAALTAADITGFTDTQIAALGTNIQFLSNAALSALTYYTATQPGHTVGQIETISPQQIAVLSPAQIRFIGAAGPGGATLTSQISWLNVGTWAALVNDPLQVAAITPAETATLIRNMSEKITALGLNINKLSNAALGQLTAGFSMGNGAQIAAISAAQIAVLTPAQVRFIGSTGVGGATTTSQITALNVGAWAALASDPLQVAAITPAEVATLTFNCAEKITALGLNINKLSNAALGQLTAGFSFGCNGAQIQAITAAQIATFTPAQVRLLGSTGIGGATTTSQIAWLNVGAWATLVADPLQVAAMTAAEVASLYPNNFEKTVSLGTSIQYLTPAAIAGIGTSTAYTFSGLQITFLSAAQISVMSPAQISALAGGTLYAGITTYLTASISQLNAGAFSALNAAQIAVFTPANMALVTPAQLASLSLAAIAGFTPTTKASLTPAQVASLSPAQHTACGC
jgi:trimeric autotransporter adhesin